MRLDECTSTGCMTRYGNGPGTGEPCQPLSYILHVILSTVVVVVSKLETIV